MFLRSLLIMSIVLLTSCSGGGSGSDGDGGGDGGGAEPTGDISMIAPYASESEFFCIPEAYDSSAAHNSPWGFEHLGVDLEPVSSGARIQAVADLTVEEINRYQNPGNGLWQVNMYMRYNGTYTVGYYIEPEAPSDAALDAQVAAIVVSVGQTVKQGDLIGAIVEIGENMLVHFDLWKDGENICPEPYFTADADAGLLRLLHVCRPDANLCYE